MKNYLVLDVEYRVDHEPTIATSPWSASTLARDHASRLMMSGYAEVAVPAPDCRILAADGRRCRIRTCGGATMDVPQIRTRR